MESKPTNNDTNSGVVDSITPHAHDILCGRGGVANTHMGNLNYRELVERLKLFYIAHPRSDKKYVAESIVMAIASQHPPGRFLRKDKDTCQWLVVNKKGALRKTKQALREKPVKQRVHQNLGNVNDCTNPDSEHETNDRTESEIISAISPNTIFDDIVPDQATIMSTLTAIVNEASDTEKDLMREGLQIFLDDLED